MVALYEITAEHRAALEALSNMDDLTDEIIQDSLAAIEGEFEGKALNVAGYFQNLEVNINGMKDAEKRIKDRRVTMQNEVDRLKDYLRTNMADTGTNKIWSPEFSVSLSKAPKDSVVFIYDESKLKDKYLRIKKEPDKILIAKLLRDGEVIEGAKLVDGQPKLTIK